MVGRGVGGCEPTIEVMVKIPKKVEGPGRLVGGVSGKWM